MTNQPCNFPIAGNSRCGPATRFEDGIAYCDPCYWAHMAGGTRPARADRPKLALIPEDHPENSCGCGCGERIFRVRGFRPGHDARLAARLKDGS